MRAALVSVLSEESTIRIPALLRRPLVAALSVSGVVLLVAIVGALAVKGYDVPWTGFGARLGADGKREPARTLWDWLALVLVPVAVAVIAWGLNGARTRADARIDLDRARQKALDDYLGLFGDAPAAPPSVNSSLMRARTLAVFRVLDGGRKAQVLQFLIEAGLISRSPGIDLVGADLSDADLENAVLPNAALKGIDFRRATFRNARLVGAVFAGSDFREADFEGANIAGADFRHAILDRDFPYKAHGTPLTDRVRRTVPAQPQA